MPGALGPILTTGVALSAAVVVVVNPVSAPHADVRIPAAQAEVSMAGGQAVDMLDEDFIEAVGPKPAGSTNPLAILKDLVSALVADAADFGKSAVLRAFIAGTGAVSGAQVPELTAASFPYIPGPETLPALHWPTVPVPEELRPVVEQALTAIISDARDMTDPRVVAAAFAAGAALAVEESPVLTNLRVLVDDRLEPALDKAAAVAWALPEAVIGDVIRDTVERYLPSVDSPAPSGRGENLRAGLLAGGASAGVGEFGATASRQVRPVAARTASPPPAGGVDSADAEPASPKPSFPGLGSAAAAGIAGLHRPVAGDGARGAIGRAVKGSLERARN
ncbi:MAG: hypothetical protein KIH64_004535 [Mycobacterium sp.]|nr:hypothetical protein [Mycobacterium sp.]